MIWSGFSMRLFGVEIGGVAWALAGGLSAVVVVLKNVPDRKGPRRELPAGVPRGAAR
jgi:hypothetical protein